MKLAKLYEARQIPLCLERNLFASRTIRDKIGKFNVDIDQRIVCFHEATISGPLNGEWNGRLVLFFHATFE